MKKNKNKKNAKQIFISILKWACGIMLVGIISLALFLFFLLKDETINKVDLQKILDTKQTTFFYDNEDSLITGVYFGENRVNVSLNDIPKHVIDAFIAIEDKRFFNHEGIDVRRIAGSLIADIKAGGYVEGASTITQQLVKLSQLTAEKTMVRKLKEAYMAIELEQICSKEEILEMYFNYVYFGSGAYGIEAASRTYFNKGCADLTLAEGALLAGVINSASRYAPHINPEASVERRNLVLSLMADQGYISAEKSEVTKKEELVLDMTKRDVYKYGFFVDSAMKEACNVLGITQEEFLSAGYSVFTTMDTQLQEKTETLMKNPEYFPDILDDGSVVQGALVIMDSRLGCVRAIAGAREYTVNGALNRATSVKRQPGSAIKPILVYASAVEYGELSPASPLLDAPVDINGYAPKNYNETYKGWITARQALALSLNCPAVELLNKTGVERSKAFASRLGIIFDDTDDHLAIALGGMAYGTTPLELCNSYQAFANSGKYVAASFVKRICDSEGKVIYSAAPVSYNAMKAETAYLVTDMMRSVVTDGTAKALQALEIDIAAKTGSVGATRGDGNKDVWMCAYTTDYTLCFWAGYDKQNISLPSSYSPGNAPSKIAIELFSDLYSNTKPTSFPIPSGIVSVKIDMRAQNVEHALKLASMYTPKEYVNTEIFDRAYAPTVMSDYWDVPNTPHDLSAIINSEGKPYVRFIASQGHIMYRIIREHGQERITVKDIIAPAGTLVEFVDEETQSGERYDYYVIPMHTEIKVNNTLLQGKPTGRVSVISCVPFSTVPHTTPPGVTPPPNIWRVFG